MTLFWLSFADPDRRKGFLGAVITDAEIDILAVMKTHDLGINPSGEVAIAPIPAEMEDQFPPEFRDRLLSREEAEKF